jgi:putative membrane protein
VVKISSTRAARMFRTAAQIAPYDEHEQRRKMMKKKIALFTGFLLSLPLALFAGWGGGCYNDSYWHGGHHWFGGSFFGGGLFIWIITLLVFGFLIFLAVKYFSTRRGDMFTKENPMDILKVRFAKGEITREEFDNIKKDMLST